MSKQHAFVHMKTTKKFYRFQEVDSETGVIFDKGDPGAEFNFGCIYLKKDHFQIEPHHLEITVQAFYEEEK